MSSSVEATESRQIEGAAPIVAVASSTFASVSESNRLYLGHSTIHLALRSTTFPVSDAAYQAVYVSIPIQSLAPTGLPGETTISTRPQPQPSQQPQQPQETSISISQPTTEGTIMAAPQQSEQSDASNAASSAPRSLSREAQLGIVFGCIGAVILIVGAAMFYYYRREPLRKMSKMGGMDNTVVPKSSISRPQVPNLMGTQVLPMSTAVTISASPFAEPRKPLPSIPDRKSMSYGGAKTLESWGRGRQGMDRNGDL